MDPFGLQVVIYLFLAGIAAGAAFMASFALASRSTEPFHGGRRGLVLALVCALAGALFLILDLTRPGDFLLILTEANSGSAISWGARILVLFILAAAFVWTTVRRWGEAEIARGFQGLDNFGLWILRLAALGLAVYPGFVLRQVTAFPLWQNPLLVPLIAVSAFHAGTAAMLLFSSCEDCKRKARGIEIVLGLAQLALVTAIFIMEGASPLAWGVALAVGTVLPLLFVIAKPRVTFAPRLVLILLGVLAIRYWLITEGQSI